MAAIDMSDMRKITNKYLAKCPVCSEQIHVGITSYYHTKIKKCICLGCIKGDLPSYIAPAKRPKIFGLWSQTEVIACLYALNVSSEMIERCLDKCGVQVTPSTTSTINTTISDIKSGLIKPQALSSHSQTKLKEILTELSASYTEPVAAPVQTTQVSVDLSQYVKRTEMDAAIAKLEETISAVEQREPLEVVIRKSATVKIKAGVQHLMFPTLLAYIGLGQNVWLTGPAGSGKTRCAREVAKHLGLSYYSKSLSKMSPVSHLLGYMDANGKYVRTSFRDALEKGGLFLLDEVDAGPADVLVAFNDALAADIGDLISFPDGMVEKHADFVAIAAANTYGGGANREYVGRVQQDAAALDRFTFLDFPYDPALEMHISGNEKWVLRIQLYRKCAEELGIRHVISPRASVKGAQALEIGRSLAEVERALIWKGLEESAVLKIQAKAALLSAAYKIL